MREIIEFFSPPTIEVVVTGWELEFHALDWSEEQIPDSPTLTLRCAVVNWRREILIGDAALPISKSSEVKIVVRSGKATPAKEKSSYDQNGDHNGKQPKAQGVATCDIGQSNTGEIGLTLTCGLLFSDESIRAIISLLNSVHRNFLCASITFFTDIEITNRSLSFRDSDHYFWNGQDPLLVKTAVITVKPDTRHEERKEEFRESEKPIREPPHNFHDKLLEMIWSILWAVFAVAGIIWFGKHIK